MEILKQIFRRRIGRIETKFNENRIGKTFDVVGKRSTAVGFVEIGREKFRVTVGNRTYERQRFVSNVENDVDSTGNSNFNAGKKFLARKIGFGTNGKNFYRNEKL